MFLCSFCGNEHEDDREFCPETGDKIELHMCFNENCAKLVDWHSVECPHCGQLQYSREEYLTSRGSKAVGGQWRCVTTTADEVISHVKDSLGEYFEKFSKGR